MVTCVGRKLWSFNMDITFITLLWNGLKGASVSEPPDYTMVPLNREREL